VGIKGVDQFLSDKGIGYYCKKGNKPAPNQDDFCILIDGETVIIGVFDGHGIYGHICSNIVQHLIIKFLLSNPNYKLDPELALKQCFAQCDAALRVKATKEGQFSILFSGTTAVFMMHRGSDLYIAHVGDSRAVLARLDNSGALTALSLTRDHWPEIAEERCRVEGCNGEIRKQDSDSPSRIFGRGEDYPGLAMSRAIGDDIGKCFGVIPEPEVSHMKIDNKCQFVSLCSDGVWEFMRNDEVAAMIHTNGKGKARKSAFAVAQQAYNLWIEHESNTSDDITCVIYYL